MVATHLLQRHHKAFQVCRRSFSSSARTCMPYHILFCGSDEFAKTALIALHGAKDVCSSIFVLTSRDAPNTWESNKRVAVSPVRVWAEKNGLEHDTVPEAGLHKWEVPLKFQKGEPAHADTVLVTASFGHLVPKAITGLFPPANRLNLHPSMLPELSGAAPIQWAIARKYFTTGVTVQSIGPKFDSGDVYAQEEKALTFRDTYETLEKELAKIGSQLLLKVLRDLPVYAKQAWPQSNAPEHLKHSTAPKIKRSDSEVNWLTMSGQDIEARHRAFGYLYPLTTYLKNLEDRIILRDVQVVEDYNYRGAMTNSFHQAGVGYYHQPHESLTVHCRRSSSLLGIKRIQTEGRKEMSAKDWVNGYKDRRNANKFFQFILPERKETVSGDDEIK